MSASLPRSPVGYQVVEVLDERAPAPRPPSPRLARSARQPWSPVGYGIVQIAEEGSGEGYGAVTKPDAEPRREPLTDAHPTFPRPWRLSASAVAIAVGGTALAGVVVVLMVASQSWGPPSTLIPDGGWGPPLSHPPNVVGQMPAPAMPVPLGCAPQPLVEARIPEVDRAAPAEKPPAEALPNLDVKPPAANPPAERETFGTAVKFVRNPKEAARLAQAADKLTFLLHVSGNFEDDRFT